MREFDSPSTFDGSTYGFVVAGHFNEPDTYVTKRPHGMGDWLICYTLEGEGYFTIPGREAVCYKGDVTLLKPGTPHQYGTKKGRNWHFVWAHFPPLMMETRYLPIQDLLVHRVESGSARKRIFRAFKRAISDSRERRNYWQQLSENAVREILFLLLQRVNKQLDPRIEETLHLLSNHMRDPVRIEQLAKAVGLSPSRLSHLFKENTGRSIVDSLNQMRLHQAALLLEKTDRNAAEVSLDVGFQNYNHFAKLFVRQYGVNPSRLKVQRKQL
jgi:AraC family transcriptional regulator of arabinose operon